MVARRTGTRRTPVSARMLADYMREMYMPVAVQGAIPQL